MTLMGFDTFRDVDRPLEQNMPQGRRTWALPIEAFLHGETTASSDARVYRWSL